MLKIKEFIKNNYFYIIGLIIGLVYFNLSSVIQIFADLPENFVTGTIFYRYSTNNEDTWLKIVERTEYYFTDIIIWFKEFNFLDFMRNVIVFLNDLLLFLINYVLNAFIYLYFFFYLFISKDVYEIKMTRGALAFINFIALLKILKKKIKIFLSYLKKNKSKIILSLCILFTLQSFLIKAVIELLIFLFYYLMSSINLDLHIIFYHLLKSFFIFLYINIPLWLIIITFLYVIWLYSIHKANQKKQKNHDQLKVFTKYDLPFFTIINGKPSVGKTRLLVQLALACEENYIDEVEETLNQIEISHPEVNFAEVIDNHYRHITEYPEHYEYYRYMKRKTSWIISGPLSVIDPYTDSLSHVLDFNYIRPNIPGFKAVLEKYTVILLSELDKEYNSHYTMKDVGEDGLHVTFGVGSHWLERKAKIIADYQIVTQLPLNIRGNSELFLYVEETKYKMPLLLNLFSLPFKWLYSIIQSITLNYESYKLKLVKHSMRESKRIRKRKDYTFLYSVFRFTMYYLSKIINYFHNYSYMKFYVLITDKDNNTISRIKLNVNCFDEQWRGSRLYDSTFLSEAYKEKSELIRSRWDNVPVWSSLTPSRDELSKINSRFIDKAFDLNTHNQGERKYDQIKTSF